KMALNGMQFFDLITTQTYGTASGSMVKTLAGAFTPGSCGVGIACLDAAQFMSSGWARFDFADGNFLEGKARGDGFAGKVGAVYKVSNDVHVGLTYHSKTWLGDMEANGATVSMNVAGPGVGGGPVTIPVTGKIQVKDFQWPQTAGVGLAYKATPELLIVFDYKWINWADVMKDFKMTFTADATQADLNAKNFGLGGQSLDAALYQKWKDQHVFMIGAGYKVSPEWTLRAGFNYANNPIPDTYLNALFPAIEKTHVTIGAGYMISTASSIDASFTYAPEVKATSGPNAPEGATVAHSQTNAQIMYGYRF
ncbi:MAG TPA: outer membrane protein transport protein, partial [Nitrospirota bacterium]